MRLSPAGAHGPPFDCAMALAVQHHVPSSRLRERVLCDVAGLLAPQGLLLLSTWQFLDSARMRRKIAEEAEKRDLKVAVNRNGRWAPPWRVATLLIQDGVIGDVLAVTHLYDMKYGWIPGTHFDDMKHFAIYDYSVHWVDITRCWMEGKTPLSVRARDYRTPNQPDEGKTPWGLWVEIAYEDGANAMIRGVGCAETQRRSHPFWIHGTEGTIRGSVLRHDCVELEKDGVFCRYQLEGEWFPDGFAGTMGELLLAISEDREPYNSAHHNLLSLEMTLAAVSSADRDGQPVSLQREAT